MIWPHLSARERGKKTANGVESDLAHLLFFFFSRFSSLSLFLLLSPSSTPSQDSAQVQFKTKKTTQLKKLMKAYCERMNREFGEKGGEGEEEIKASEQASEMSTQACGSLWLFAIATTLRVATPVQERVQSPRKGRKREHAHAFFPLERKEEEKSIGLPIALTRSQLDLHQTQKK